MVWGGAQVSAFPVSSQVMPGPHSEELEVQSKLSHLPSPLFSPSDVRLSATFISSPPHRLCDFCSLCLDSHSSSSFGFPLSDHSLIITSSEWLPVTPPLRPGRSSILVPYYSLSEQLFLSSLLALTQSITIYLFVALLYVSPIRCELPGRQDP